MNITLENGRAITIFQAIVNSLQQKGTPMENILGCCSDMCNFMFGKNHLVETLLDKEISWIMTIKCSCHLIRLCRSLCMDFMTVTYVHGNDLCTLEQIGTSHKVANTDVYFGMLARDSIQEIVADLGNDHSEV